MQRGGWRSRGQGREQASERGRASGTETILPLTAPGGTPTLSILKYLLNLESSLTSLLGAGGGAAGSGGGGGAAFCCACGAGCAAGACACAGADVAVGVAVAVAVACAGAAARLGLAEGRAAPEDGMPLILASFASRMVRVVCTIKQIQEKGTRRYDHGMSPRKNNALAPTNLAGANY
jgi:hypothetical protein